MSDRQINSAYLVTEVMHLLIQVVGLLLQLAQRLVLSSQISEELVFSVSQQVFSASTGFLGLFHWAEWAGH